MRKIVLGLLVAAFSISANAQYMGTVPPNADVRLFYSQDTDDFKVLHTWIGAAHETGLGVRLGYSKYEGKHLLGGWRYVDNSTGWESLKGYQDNQFSSDSSIFQFTYVNIGENHDFHGAIGIRSIDYNTSTSNVDNAIGRVDGNLIAKTGKAVENVEQGYFTQNGDIEKNKLSGSHNILVANADLKLVMTDRFTIGAAVATDIVESARSIQTGTRYVYTAVDGDYLITEQLNFNIIAGNIYFTDDNNRLFVRTKTTWTFSPEYGLSTYLRTRNQYDTHPGSFNYFSPERLAQQSLGLAIRKPYNGLVYTGGVEFGSEQVTDITGKKNTHPIYGWQLGVQTSPGRKTGTTFGASAVGSNSSGIAGGGSDYNWYGFTFWMKVPL